MKEVASCFHSFLEEHPAGLDTAVELVTGTDPVAANSEAATVGCNMAVGLVGSSLADHTEVASAAVDTAFLACHYGSVPAFQLDIFVVLEVHMLGQDKDCFAVSESRDYSLFHKAEAFSLPLDPLDFPGIC